jgi:hypothetical protein
LSLSRDSRTEKKLKAYMRAQFRLKQQFEYIDYCEDVLIPEVEKLKQGKPVLGLDAGVAFDLVIDDANPDSPKTPDAD